MTEAMTDHSEVAISRLFRLRADGGHIHLRTAGPEDKAPVLLALHESPRSSFSIRPLMREIGHCVRVIAPDTPGYGLSDQLPQTPTSLADYVAPLIEMLDGLGLAKVALYGTHTGAAIACEFALEHPDRVSHLLLDGVPLFTPDEVALFSNGYFPNYSPQWDGHHVMALWSRVLDQSRWFPWHERNADHRLGTPEAQVEQLDTTVAGQLLAGSEYSRAYTLAVAYDTMASLKALKCPVTVFARNFDLLHSHLERLPTSMSSVSLGDDRAEWGKFIAGLVGNSDCGLATPPQSNSSTRRILQTSAGEVHAIRKRPSTSAQQAILPAFLSTRHQAPEEADSAWMIDPPGFGLSENLPTSALNPAAITAGVAQASEELGVAPPVFTPLPEVALRLLDQEPIPAPALDGRHLVTCWFAARNCLQRPEMSESPPLQEVERLFQSLFLAPRHRVALETIREMAPVVL